MHIFIDESGSFAIPLEARGASVSCAGALALPSSDLHRVETEFAALSSAWPQQNGEVKGRVLDERQISDALRFLAANGAILTCVAIDLGLHHSQEVLDHREVQARKLTERLTSEHDPGLVRQVLQLQSELRSITVPEYVQMRVMTTLIDRFMRTVPNYMAFRRPTELGLLDWTLDAKDANQQTRMERIWDKVCLPFVESSALRKPIITLKEADWGAFDARYSGRAEQPPEHLAPLAKWKPGETFHYMDMTEVMKTRRFADSRHCIGLQMVDVATSAARRGMQGNLGRQGWCELAGILLKPLLPGEAIQLISLHPNDRYWGFDPPYHQMLGELRETALPIVMRR